MTRLDNRASGQHHEGPLDDKRYLSARQSRFGIDSVPVE